MVCIRNKNTKYYAPEDTIKTNLNIRTYMYFHSKII